MIRSGSGEPNGISDLTTEVNDHIENPKKLRRALRTGNSPWESYHATKYASELWEYVRFKASGYFSKFYASVL